PAQRDVVMPHLGDADVRERQPRAADLDGERGGVDVARLVAGAHGDRVDAVRDPGAQVELAGPVERVHRGLVVAVAAERVGAGRVAAGAGGRLRAAGRHEAGDVGDDAARV